jgi:hypothetical protein
MLGTNIALLIAKQQCTLQAMETLCGTALKVTQAQGKAVRDIVCDSILRDERRNSTRTLHSTTVVGVRKQHIAALASMKTVRVWGWADVLRAYVGGLSSVEPLVHPG